MRLGSGFDWDRTRFFAFRAALAQCLWSRVSLTDCPIATFSYVPSASILLNSITRLVSYRSPLVSFANIASL